MMYENNLRGYVRDLGKELSRIIKFRLPETCLRRLEMDKYLWEQEKAAEKSRKEVEMRR